MNLRKVRLVMRNEITLSFRSKAFLIITGSLLAVVVLDMFALLQGQVWMDRSYIFLQEFNLQIVTTGMGIAIPLLALVSCAPSVSLERSNGTLRLVLSQDLSNDEYLIGKLLGSLLSVWVPLVLSVVVYLLLATALYGIPLDALVISSVFFGTANILLYASVFVAVGYLVSVLVKNSATAVIVAAISFALMATYASGMILSIAQLILGGTPGKMLGVFRPFTQAESAYLGNLTKLMTGIEPIWPVGALFSLQGQLVPQHICQLLSQYCTIANSGPVGLNYIAALWPSYLVLLTYFSVAIAFMVLYFRRSEK